MREQAQAIRVQDPPSVSVLELMIQYAPQMDYADACAVLLARDSKGAIVVTTDHRDFSMFRVPFISPQGRFF